MSNARRISPVVLVAFTVTFALVGLYIGIPGSEFAPVVIAVLAATNTKPPTRRGPRKGKSNT